MRWSWVGFLFQIQGWVWTVDGATNDILGRCPASFVIWEAQHISAFSRSQFSTKDSKTGRSLRHQSSSKQVQGTCFIVCGIGNCAKTSVQVNDSEKPLHVRIVILPCVTCSVVSPKLSSALLWKTRRVGWCGGNSISFRTKKAGSSAVWP